MAHTSMRVLHAEEIYSIERLGEGRVQIRALENKVVEVKNRLRLAGLQVVLLRQRLMAHGFFLSDGAAQDFSQRLQRKSMPHAPVTASELAYILTLPPALDTSPATTTDLLQEPITRPDVSSWTCTTHPGAPASDIPENDHNNALEGDDAVSLLREPGIDVTEGDDGAEADHEQGGPGIQGCSLVR